MIFPLRTLQVDLPAGDLIHLLQLRPLRVLDISDNWNVREERAAWVLGTCATFFFCLRCCFSHSTCEHSLNGVNGLYIHSSTLGAVHHNMKRVV